MWRAMLHHDARAYRYRKRFRMCRNFPRDVDACITGRPFQQPYLSLLTLAFDHTYANVKHDAGRRSILFANDISFINRLSPT